MPAREERRSLRAELMEGLRFLFADKRIRAIASSTVLFNFFSNVTFAIYLVYAVRELGLGAGTIGVVVYNITGLSFQQEIAPDRMLGRLNASRRFLVWGVIPLGTLVGGALAATLGLRPTLFVGAIGITFGALPAVFSPLRSLGPGQSPARASASNAQA